MWRVINVDKCSFIGIVGEQSKAVAWFIAEKSVSQSGRYKLSPILIYIFDEFYTIKLAAIIFKLQVWFFFV